jgi:hypothetical protein
LYLVGDARHKAVRRLVKPNKIPGHLPFGPLNKTAYTPITAPRDNNDLASGLRDWYENARNTWHSLLGSEVGPSTHSFRWEPATGRLASRNMGATNTSAELRAMEGRVKEIANQLANGKGIVDGPTMRHLTRNRKSCSLKCMKHDTINATALTGWCTSVEKATTEKNPAALRKLAKVLDKKADAIHPGTMGQTNLSIWGMGGGCCR